MQPERIDAIERVVRDIGVAVELRVFGDRVLVEFDKERIERCPTTELRIEVAELEVKQPGEAIELLAGEAR